MADFEEKLEKVYEFLKNNKGKIGVAFVGLVVLLLVLLFLSAQERKKMERASMFFERGYNYYIRGFSETNKQNQNQLYDAAASQFLNAVDAYPDGTPGVRARIYLARIYYDRGKYDTAIGYLQEIPDVSKSEFYLPLAYMFLAECYLQKNDVSTASEFYSKIYREFPDSGFAPSAVAGMAVCRELAGNSEDAKQMWIELTNRYPDSYWVDFALENIEFLNVKKELGVGISKQSVSPLK